MLQGVLAFCNQWCSIMWVFSVGCATWPNDGTRQPDGSSHGAFQNRPLPSLPKTCGLKSPAGDMP